MAEQVYTEEQCTNYQFGNEVPGPGYDPETSGFRSPSPGEHLVEVIGFGVASGKEFRWKGESCILNQLRPQLKVIGGPDDGAEIIDFLPMPTPGAQMLGPLASQWGQFLRSLGFPVSKELNQLVPSGFALPQIKGRRAKVTIVFSVGEDGNIRSYRGRQQVRVDLFGYKSAASSANTTSATRTPNPAMDGQQGAAQQSVTPPPAAPGFNI